MRLFEKIFQIIIKYSKIFFLSYKVVSELWDKQCVRLRVNVKSDNCGENAECSGKGICYSNASMVSENLLENEFYLK